MGSLGLAIQDDSSSIVYMVPMELLPNSSTEAPTESRSAGSGQKDILDLDVWVLIFKELNKITSNLCNYRSISRRLEGAIIPLVFETWRVNGRLLSNPDWRGTAKLVQEHTRRLVFVEKDLNWDQAAKFVKECRYVQDFKWKCNYVDMNVSFPAVLRKAIADYRPPIQIHLEIFYDEVKHKTRPLTSPDFDSFPAPENLVSFLMRCDFWSFPPDEIQRYLVKAKGLQTFRTQAGRRFFCEPASQIRDFDKEFGRLPPIKHLIVGGEPFKRCLEHISCLVELSVKCYRPAEMIDFLLPHSHNLEILRLADFMNAKPSIGVDELILLKTRFSNLHHLEIDIHFPLFNLHQKLHSLSEQKKNILIRTDLLHILSATANLRTLHIRPSTTPCGPGDACRKKLCGAIVHELTTHKQGKPFREIVFHWRCGRLAASQYINPGSGPTWEFSVMRYEWNIYGENLRFGGRRGRKVLV